MAKLEKYIPNWPVTLLALLVTLSYFELPGRTEGILFPVLELRDVQAQHVAGGMMISGTLDKHRDCPLIRIDWHYPNGTLASLSVPDAQEERSYPKGVNQPLGRYFVRMPREEFPRSTVETYHRCHWAWLTKTLAWNGAKTPPTILPENDFAPAGIDSLHHKKEQPQ